MLLAGAAVGARALNGTLGVTTILFAARRHTRRAWPSVQNSEDGGLARIDEDEYDKSVLI